MRRKTCRIAAVALAMLPWAAWAESALDPAAKVSCLPSRECAVELARAYAQQDAKQSDDPGLVLGMLGGITWMMINARDPAAPGAVDQFIAAVRTSKNPDLQTVAAMQAAIGRRDAALATIREIREEKEAREIVEGIARRAVEEKRVDDARAFLQTLRADRRVAVGVILVEERLQDKDLPGANAFVAASQIDLGKMPALSFRMILAEDGDARFKRALAQLKSMTRDDAAFSASGMQIPRGASPAALPLLRYARELHDADRETSTFFDFACTTLAVHFADAGAAKDADAIASTCKPQVDVDDFRREMVSAHAFAGNYDAANRAAAGITDTYSRADALSYIAQAKVLIGKQPIEAAFANVRDASVQAERLVEIAADQREERRNADALATLRLAASAARRETDRDSRSVWLSHVGDEMAQLGAYAEANELLPQIKRNDDRLSLLCAVGVGAAKSQDRRRAVAAFDVAHDIAAKEEMDAEAVQNIIECQASAALTQEAWAAARRMPPSEGERDISRELAFEAVIVAMAKRGELAQAFALAKAQEPHHSLIFQRIYEALAAPRKPAD